MEIVVKAVGMGLVLALLIGPVFFTLIQTSIHRGFSSGMYVAIGILLSDSLFIILSVLGIAEFFSRYESLFGYGGCLIFIAFGISGLLKNRKKISDNSEGLVEKNKLKLIMKGFVINSLSPFVLVFWIGAVTYVSTDFSNDISTLFSFFAITISVVFISDLLKAFLSHKIKRLLTVRFLRILNTVTSLVFLVAGIRIFFHYFLQSA
ncbi:MAG: LysE family translocator [Cyclobacteriaceae bacterium]|nr:LysE family translocator [Cyclobacteriaceae bacterium]